MPMIGRGLAILFLVSVAMPYSIKRTVSGDVHTANVMFVVGLRDPVITDFGLSFTFPGACWGGVQVGVRGLGMSSDQVYRPVLTAEIGLIEMTPTKYLSPYLVQRVGVGFFKEEAKSYTHGSLFLGIGLEIRTDFPLSLFGEGGLDIIGGDLAVGGGIGLRCAF